MKLFLLVHDLAGYGNIAGSTARCRRTSECSFVRERLTGQAGTVVHALLGD